MASRQASKSTDPPSRQLTPLEKYGFPATMFALAAAVSPISQLTMAPVYGSIPSAVNHTIAIIFACAVGFGSWIADGSPRRSQHIWITVFPFWVPVLQYFLLPYSNSLGPVTGAMINGGISCHAVLVASIYALAEALAVFDLTSFVGPRVGDTVKAALLVPAFLGMEKKMGTWITTLLSNSKTLNPIHLQLALGSAYSLFFPSWYLLLGLPALIHTFLANPHTSSAMTNAALNSQNWTLIDRQWSTTGYVSVLDSFNDNYRVLRCDHSLLGGEWQLTEQRKKEGWKMTEPIYSAFVMLEAIRLMPTKPEIPDNQAQALVIGLGVGTAPKAFIAHGIDTTVVELDPIVHAFATQYFDLPQNHTDVLEDATSWVNKTASQGEQKYDYIIHDVFTGGAEPLELFNAQFLRDLRSLLKPHGAIAMNYAGDLVNPLTHSALHTIDAVFSGRSQCKIFRDGPRQKSPATEGSEEDFTNMVVFCKNGGDDKPNSKSESDFGAFFRSPRKADYLGSKSRQQYLLPKPENEIPFPDPDSPPVPVPSDTPDEEPVLINPFKFQSLLAPIRALRDPATWNEPRVETHTHAPYTPAEMEVVEPGDERKYAKQQEETAIRHWYIMRSVLPDAVWELW